MSSAIASLGQVDRALRSAQVDLADDLATLRTLASYVVGRTTITDQRLRNDPELIGLIATVAAGWSACAAAWTEWDEVAQEITRLVLTMTGGGAP
jgi:hypothetical protein